MFVIASSRVISSPATMPTESAVCLRLLSLETVRLSYVHVASHQSNSRFSATERDLPASIMLSTPCHRLLPLMLSDHSSRSEN